MGPTTSSAQSSALAEVSTRADRAVLLTGTPWGPFEASRVASSPSPASGVTVCPIVVSTIAPTPEPAATNRPRRSMAGISGGGTVPALLCARGFWSQGISVSTSASASLAWSPYLMSGSFIATWSRIEPMTT